MHNKAGVLFGQDDENAWNWRVDVPPFACNPLNGITVSCTLFFRKQCILLITWDGSNIQLTTAFSFIFIYWKCHAENMRKAISMTLNLKMVWGNMLPSPLVWSPKGTVTFLLVCTPSKSDTTPLALQRLEAVTQSLFSGLESNFKVKSPSKIQWNEAIFGSSPG